MSSGLLRIVVRRHRVATHKNVTDEIQHKPPGMQVWQLFWFMSDD